MPGGILWLASYPKSGNTWLRAFLANYLANSAEPLSPNEITHYSSSDTLVQPYEELAGKPAASLSEDEVRTLRPETQMRLATRSTKTVPVKTHNLLGHEGGVPLILPQATAGAIYILRNPLDVAVSFAYHTDGDLDTGVRALTDRQTVMEGEPERGLLPSFVGSWTLHVRSWTETPGLNPHVMRYEDMLTRPREAFAALIRFLGMPEEPERLQRAIEFSSFDTLKQGEAREGFLEAASGREFFRSGSTGGWREALSEAQAGRIISVNAATMRKFGYLDEQGNVIDRPGGTVPE
ncbi:MAG: sulfotransferase domain-containing protein [Rhodovibrionaceae bacterium]|nr:sulfotransferase domain-containing protein [Rhodovibrionaceae bacterium]